MIRFHSHNWALHQDSGFWATSQKLEHKAGSMSDEDRGKPSCLPCPVSRKTWGSPRVGGEHSEQAPQNLGIQGTQRGRHDGAVGAKAKTPRVSLLSLCCAKVQDLPPAPRHFRRGDDTCQELRPHCLPDSARGMSPSVGSFMGS